MEAGIVVRVRIGMGAFATLALLAVTTFATADARASAPKITAHAETPVVNLGETLQLALTAKNSSKAKSAKTSAKLLLSEDPRASKDDLPLKGKAKIPALGPRKSKTVRVKAKLPKQAAEGAYSVLVCAPKCRAMKGTVGVGAPVQRVNVAPQLAGDDRSASAVIDATGGRVDAIGPDNSLYSLIVPEGALASPTQIKITPLTGLDGSPLGGGLVGGVDLAPEGLELARAATLVMQGDRFSSSPDQIAFGYHGGGEDFHLEPFHRQAPQGLEGVDPSRSVLVPVSHFSGTGVQPATDIDTVRDLRYGAMEAQDRLAEETAKAIEKERDTGESSAAELERIMGEYLDQVVLPNAAAASFSDALYISALQSYISWERQRQLLFIDGDFAARIAQVEKLLDRAFTALVKRLRDRCAAGDLGMQAKIISLQRQLELLGLTDKIAELTEAIDGCYRFELRVISHLEHHLDGDLGGGWYAKDDFSIELKGATPLTLDGPYGLGKLSGTGPFEYRQVDISGSGRVDFGGFGHEECTFYGTGTTQNGQLDVLDGTLPYTSAQTGGAAIPASILFDPGDPQEEVHYDCRGSALGQPTSTNENTWEQNWQRYFKSTHGPESQNQSGNGPWLLNRFEPRQHPILGEQTVNYSSDQYAYSLTETFQLVHTPLPE